MEKYYFIVTKNNDINLYDTNSNKLIAMSWDKFCIEDDDFWTTFDIDGKYFDINIYRGESDCIPIVGDLYEMPTDTDGNIINEYGDYDSYSLEFEIGYEFDKNFNISQVIFTNLPNI